MAVGVRDGAGRSGSGLGLLQTKMRESNSYAHGQAAYLFFWLVWPTPEQGMFNRVEGRGTAAGAVLLTGLVPVY